VTAAPEFEHGISSRVPWDDYAAIDATSISRLKEIGRSPLHYAYRLDHPKESPPLILGTAAHTAVLEPERFARQFAVWTRRSDSGNLCPRRGQYWDAFEAESAGKTIITEDEFELATAMHGAVRSHPVAAAYLAAGDPEVTLQWLGLGGRRCKGRVDWLMNSGDVPVLCGLKTARDCRHMIFGSAAAKLGYHLQWAWYHDGYAAIRGTEPKVVEIVVESEPPHAVAVYSIPQDIIAQGRDEYARLLEQLEACEATGEFPGPHEIEEPLTLPDWIYAAHDDLAELGLE
jgi:hypothetical protein